jgi:hypothetical protein
MVLSDRRYLAAALGSAAIATCGLTAWAPTARPDDARRTYSRQAVFGRNFRHLLGEVWQPQTTQVEKKS